MTILHLITQQIEINREGIFAVYAGLSLIALFAIILRLSFDRRNRQHVEQLRNMQAQAAEAELIELKGRLLQATEMSSIRQDELARTVSYGLERVSQHLNSTMISTERNTSDQLSKLHERLAIIDHAQKNITELSGRVVSLQDILGNKQTRGAFGQMRMEFIIEDGLPKNSFEFQATLSNGKRPDCIIRLPNILGVIVVDAKFPLEGFEALRTARDEIANKEAKRQIRIAVGKHIDDMAEKYFIVGETQDNALLFVPAESIYVELHEGFPDLIQRAHRARIVIVSPNILMLAVQTMMAVMKDARMQEEAGLIRREVGLLSDDVSRLRDRVLDFQRHYLQLGPDLEKIVVSSDKIVSRGRRISCDEPTNYLPNDIKPMVAAAE